MSTISTGLQHTEAPHRTQIDSSHHLEPRSALSGDPQAAASLRAPRSQTADRAVEEQEGGEVQVLGDGWTDCQSLPSESKIQEQS